MGDYRHKTRICFRKAKLFHNHKQKNIINRVKFHDIKFK